MTLAAPARPSNVRVVGAHPLARIAAAAALMLFVFVTLDALTAGVVLVAVIAAAPWAGADYAVLRRRAWPLAAAAVAIGTVNALLTPRAGGEMLTVGPVRLTDDALVIGASLALRLLAVGVTALVGVTGIDATELADGLTQQLRLPARFTIGALAGARLVPLFRAEWETLGLARRARGIDAGRSPVVAAALFAGRVNALLAGAIRRGLRMAHAMDARGFGALPCRTSARERRIGRRDVSLVAGAVAVGVAATAASVALGTWTFVLG
ncbi:MAG: energy-coupling factor transporter transmembrane protein EcfT [Chloroflexota bacterium]|nr:energy-coupling factor transporter transmembrane protein EcfT [Chloroflexota bacterium]